MCSSLSLEAASFRAVSHSVLESRDFVCWNQHRPTPPILKGKPVGWSSKQLRKSSSTCKEAVRLRTQLPFSLMAHGLIFLCFHTMNAMHDSHDSYRIITGC